MTENIHPKSSGRGGARKGAGRKPGSATKKTREIADRAASAGITPLEVMIETMLMLRKAGEHEKAAMIAKDAAPYVHPRLSSIDAKVKVTAHESALEELS